MEAIVLAGGFGKRLQSVVKDVPKPMADINGKPFLAYLLNYLKKQRIEKILLSVGYKHEIISSYFGNKYENMEIKYIVEDKPLGTGGAIKLALGQTKEKDVFILNGDTFFPVNFKKLKEFHESHNSLVTICLKHMNDFDRYGTVILQDEKVKGFKEKSFQKSGYINGGIYLVQKNITSFFNEMKEVFSFEVDFLQKKIDDIASFGFVSDDYFIDIGIPEDYARANKELTIFEGNA